jgi:hypothetical protein
MVWQRKDSQLPNTNSPRTVRGDRDEHTLAENNRFKNLIEIQAAQRQK